MEITDNTIQNLIAELDLADNVTCEVYNANRPCNYIIAIYDRREKKPVSASWQCNEKEVAKKFRDIQKLYGKESYGQM